MTKLKRFIITDQDGDRLEVDVTYAFGPPMLIILTGRYDDPGGTNLTIEQAKELRAWLDDFLRISNAEATQGPG